MTRAAKIQTALLDVLSEWGEPVDEAVLHAQIDSKLSGRGEPEAQISEFNHALKGADAEGWIAKVESGRRGLLWSITNKGKAERLA